MIPEEEPQEAVPCDEPGCASGLPGLPCWLPADQDDPSFHYCGEHIVDNGFCAGCGLFWAGVERFDFNPRGLCENCDAEIDEPESEDDDWYCYEGLP